jgi:hypothetical protein
MDIPSIKKGGGHCTVLLTIHYFLLLLLQMNSIQYTTAQISVFHVHCGLLQMVSNPILYKSISSLIFPNTAYIFFVSVQLYLCLKIRIDKIGEICSINLRDEKFIQNFSRIPERKRPLGRYRRRLESNIKLILRTFLAWGCGLNACGLG